MRSAKDEKQVSKVKKEIESEIQELTIETSPIGIVLKTDTLGSLEAVSKMLQNKGIEIKKAEIGNINKKDLMEAIASAKEDPLQSFILGFNVKIEPDVESKAKGKKIEIISDSVIYKLIERYEEAVENKKKLIELEKLAGITWPAKFKILPGYVSFS